MHVALPDESKYENDVFNEGNNFIPTFIQNIKDKKKYGILETTPYGNQILLEFAKARYKK